MDEWNLFAQIQNPLVTVNRVYIFTNLEHVNGSLHTQQDHITLKTKHFVHMGVA